MPLGDPGGGNFEYTTEGLPKEVAFVEVPVKDMKRAIRFYCGILKFGLVSSSDDTSVLKLGPGCKIALVRRPNDVGKDTGIYLTVESPYEFNRRMVDEGVLMIRHPQKGPLGVFASFKDDDGNTLHVIGRS
ncbi:MAG: VOC family protein [Methanomassiliicoccaceae archaeon]|jgi:predicted enzyme related to lactoylglutathione lyase|nr:VOC family protein [Methanomassiliicoccaceae archaeon]